MWIIAVIVIGSLILLGILLLSIPFDLSVELNVRGKTDLSLHWMWFFGLVRKDVKFKKGVSEREKARPKRGLIKNVERLRLASNIIRTRGFVGRIVRLVKRTFHRIKIKKLETGWLIGLDAPDETFYLFALIEPVRRLLNCYLPYPVSIRTSFIGPVFEGYLESDLRLYPILLVLPLFLFIFSLPVLRVIKQVAVARWKRNR